jgi:excisionase family DNA binding protein
MKALLSAQETALMLGCSIAAIRKWAYQGRLKRVKVGRLARFQLDEVERIAANGLPPRSGANPRVARNA